MKIIITGSLGHISKPLTKELVQKGHSVTVISSKPERQKEIESLGAAAAIGTVEDADFLAKTFTGADAVYTMTPPTLNFNDQDENLTDGLFRIVKNYAQAIRHSGVQHVVHLSSIGAHSDKGVGILSIYHTVEAILNTLPGDVAIAFLRPVGFYYNLYAFVDTIKKQGVIAANYGGDVKKPWVSPVDIAMAAAEELLSPLKGRKIRYIASDEISCNELAGLLGAAIGKPDLKWIIIPDEQVLAHMVAGGMNPKIAAGFVEMNASGHSGILYEDYNRNKPVLGKHKLADFAKEFAYVFNNK